MKNPIMFILIVTVLPLFCTGQEKNSRQKADSLALAIEAKVIEWRRFFHQNPELSNREFKTGLRIASELRRMGLQVQTRVAHTGVVGILTGELPGPTIALRADIDALPVTEQGDLPFASKSKSKYNGVETGVMHACGHDGHIAIMLGVAEVLSDVKAHLNGTVKFIFQPAEEGVPIGEVGGAKMMVDEGVLTNPDVDVIFGLHVAAGLPVGQVAYRFGGLMASSDRFIIKVTGIQAHGSTPWSGIDPIVTAAQIINNLQTIVSRETSLIEGPAVVTVGMIKGGIRYNIIPETVEMIGTVRALDKAVQAKIHTSIKRIATNTAEAMGATVSINFENLTPVTNNDPMLMNNVLPILSQVVGKENVVEINPVTGAEDFAFYQEKVPGFYFFLGASIKEENTGGVLFGHHSPNFMINENGLIFGVKAMVHLTLNFMENPLSK